jgi:hypothetical protein
MLSIFKGDFGTLEEELLVPIGVEAMECAFHLWKILGGMESASQLFCLHILHKHLHGWEVFPLHFVPRSLKHLHRIDKKQCPQKECSFLSLNSLIHREFRN